MSKQSDVKGCPLCGGDAGRDFDFKGKLVGARCSPCGLPWMLIERWNSRPPAHTDKLADALREMVDAMYRYQNDCDDSPPLAHRGMMHRAEQALTSHESRESGDGWVRVEERLPENKIAKIVWCPERMNKFAAYWCDGRWWIFGAFETAVTGEVTHWRELPAPPTEGGAL